jgi:hypothetical protein
MHLTRRSDPNHCPGCGERVSRFAAGCALCGADLDIRRHDRRPGPLDGAATRLRELADVRRPRPLLQDWSTKPWQFVALIFVLLFSCSIAAGIATVVMTFAQSALP